MPVRPSAPGCVLAVLLTAGAGFAADKPAIDFGRDIRPILSNTCFTCHGPDDAVRRADLRLDTSAGATADLDGRRAIVPGKPDESELIVRINESDPELRMPPKSAGKTLSPKDIELLTEWVRQGAKYSKHWSYEKPVRVEPPAVSDPAWSKTAIDRFLFARLMKENLKPQPEADRYTLIRRVSLDLTGLPPKPEDVEQFVNDPDPQAYEKLVDRLLATSAYGEHWARMWLDLARYADSAGYADDPPRVIWAYRDYVIRALNANKPFDQFTIEQIAGDLLPNPTEDQLIATAFHRNTLTNNEGGTNDEEFRNVAVVDRVNTTMAVWMGTTIACAQCHTHKYDPITQADFFRFAAFFNSTEDADRTDESPRLPLYTDEQLKQKSEWEPEIARLKQVLSTPTPELLAAQAEWEKLMGAELPWSAVVPAKLTSKEGAGLKVIENSAVLVDAARKTDTYTLEMPLEAGRLSALQLETLPHPSLPGGGTGFGGGNFVLSKVTATFIPPEGTRQKGRFLRIQIPGKGKILSLAEVQAFSGTENVALKGDATQSSTDFDGPPRLAIDGNTDGRYAEAKSTTHTAISDDPWWELDLKGDLPIDRVVLWNRADANVGNRLSDFRIALLDAARKPVWEKTVAEPPTPSREFAISGARAVRFIAALADYSQPGFDAASVLENKKPAEQGWAVGGQPQTPHALTLIPEAPVEIAAGSRLSVELAQISKHENHTLGHFRLSTTADDRAAVMARTPPAIRDILKLAEQRSETQKTELTKHFLANVAPALQKERERLAQLEKQLAAELKPATSVPIFRELPADQRRVTKIQHRGNFMDLGDEVTEGIPDVFHPLPKDLPPNRLALAKWLIDDDNPLTGRVIANRYWEQIFGVGIVLTSEEFGAQGEQPSHPELLDWLATELVATKWDMKRFVKQLVTTAAYRQSSKVTPELTQRDPDNRLLASGPRFRLSAEMIRDQALAVSGLLSPKMYGPPVKPPQPSLGVNAAFGGMIDWQTSDGDDKYRRGLYTTWRRSNPYPSMATFDAPNREVCTVRRSRTNTPLQALVTLNDPVYIEAAQSLARKMAVAGLEMSDRVNRGFLMVLSRPPTSQERERIVALQKSVKARFAQDVEKAKKLATVPLGPLPEGADPADMAAWTVVGNVLLNLDETMMKR